MGRVSPEEAAESVRFLERLAREYGLTWVLREAEAAAEDRAAPRPPDAHERLIAITDAFARVLVETHELERTLPVVLLEGTNAEALVRYDGEMLVSETTLAEPGGATSDDDLVVTVAALRALRDLAENGE